MWYWLVIAFLATVLLAWVIYPSLLLPINQLTWWFARYWLLLSQLIVVLLIVWGLGVRDLGLERLFWNENWFYQLLNGLSYVWLFAVVCYIIYLFESARRKPGSPLWGTLPFTPLGVIYRIHHRWPGGPLLRACFGFYRLTLFPCRPPQKAAPPPTGWIAQQLAWLGWTPVILPPGPAKAQFNRDRVAVRRVGGYMFRVLTIALILLIVPKLLEWAIQPTTPNPPPEKARFFEGRQYLWPAAVGFMVGVLFLCVLHVVDELWGIRGSIANHPRFVGLPAMKMQWVPKDQWVLHAISLYVGGVTFVFLGVALVASQSSYSAWYNTSAITFSPFTLAALALILLSIIAAAVGFHFQRAWVLLPVLVGLGLVANAYPHKLSYPGLETHPIVKIGVEEDGTDLYERQLTATEQFAQDVLINDKQPLQAMCERWAKDHPGEKPRIVLVATSGGGIRAAVWTAVVLEGLEAEIPGVPAPPLRAAAGGTARPQGAFRDHIRLFTGASGGMVGAGYYAADFERGPSQRGGFDERTGLGELSGILAKDSLSPTFQTLVLRDIPSIWSPFQARIDRGRTLEDAWKTNSQEWRWQFRGQEHSVGPERFAERIDAKLPTERTFADLARLERQGLRPSLIFSPILIEDSRRLLISNLNLEPITKTRGTLLGSTTRPGGPSELSRHAVEFFRMFPGATTFQVGTAARMNAAFPFISPAAELPVRPVRRVADAGYSDNYGVEMAALWMWKNRDLLREYTSGVMLVHIRAYRLRFLGRHLSELDPRKYDESAIEAARERDLLLNPNTTPCERAAVSQRLAIGNRRSMSNEERALWEEANSSSPSLLAALDFLSSPLEGVENSRARTAHARNNELLMFLDEEFNRGDDKQFFVNTEFELDGTAALSWYLSQAEAGSIVHGFYTGPDRTSKRFWIDARLHEVRCWFGTGGKRVADKPKPK